MFKRKRKDVPGLDTTSTADISFMLLIFFLVTSSMDTDKGLTRQLPPPDDSNVEQLVEMKKRNVLELVLDAAGHLTCNGDTIVPEQLTKRIEEFVSNSANDPTLPEKSQREVHLLGLCQVSDRHIITVATHPNTTYDAYFQMQDAIVRGYARLRDQLARQRFGHALARCTQEERDALAIVYPQRISEAYPTTTQTQEGGEP